MERDPLTTTKARSLPTTEAGSLPTRLGGLRLSN
jgi:hypothetical protein